MTLALALGKTVSELRTLMSTDELLNWHAYYALYGFPMMHLHGSMMTGFSQLVNCWGGSSKPADFLIYDGMTAEQRQKVAVASTRAYLEGMIAQANSIRR